MKTLELNLQKRLLIVEGDMLEFKLNDKRWLNDKIKFICKGSELTEEIAETIILFNEKTGLYDGYYSPLVAFISAIEAQGYGFGKVKIDLSEPNLVKLKFEHTFNPSKTLIFEIL